MHRMRNYALTLLFGALACDGDGTGPAVPNVAGSWSYSVADLSFGRYVCTVTGTTLSIDQRGDSFSGSATGGTIDCSGPLTAFSDTVSTTLVVDGKISSEEVSFDFGNSNYHHAGTLTDGQMAGDVTLRRDGLVVATGLFTASRNVSPSASPMSASRVEDDLRALPPGELPPFIRMAR